MYPTLRAGKVRDVMTPDVVYVDENASFKEIADKLVEHEVSGLPVVAEDGRVVGVISEGDLLRKQEYPTAGLRHRFGLRHRDELRRAAANTARDLMTTPAITIRPDARIWQAASVMGRDRVKRLIVVDGGGGRLLGVVSRGDLLRVFLVGDDMIRDAVYRQVVEYAQPDDRRTVKVDVHDGVVTLAGRLERKSFLPTVVRLTHETDGVVDVVDNLTYALSGEAPPERRWETHQA